MLYLHTKPKIYQPKSCYKKISFYTNLILFEAVWKILTKDLTFTEFQCRKSDYSLPLFNTAPLLPETLMILLFMKIYFCFFVANYYAITIGYLPTGFNI